MRAIREKRLPEYSWPFRKIRIRIRHKAAVMQISSLQRERLCEFWNAPLATYDYYRVMIQRAGSKLAKCVKQVKPLSCNSKHFEISDCTWSLF